MKGAEDVRAQPWYDLGASVCVRFSFWVRPFASVSDFGGRPQPSGKTDASIRYHLGGSSGMGCFLSRSVWMGCGAGRSLAVRSKYVSVVGIHFNCVLGDGMRSK